MVRFAASLVASLAVSATAYTAPRRSSSQNNGENVAVPPSKDPFYVVPDGVDKRDPGTILNHRKPPSPIAAYGLQPENLQHSYQILYRTTETKGNATATVLTVLVPFNASYGKVLSYQVAEDAATIDCAPSYGFQLASENDPLLQSSTRQLQLLLIEAALAQGWVVVTPDFEGPKGAFAAGTIAGHAILDGIRAALNSGPITGIDNDAKVVLWGYSGGAGVTQSAALLQPVYAAELNIAGAAFGGAAIPDIDQTFNVNEGPSAGLLPAAMLGIANQYPELRELLDRNLKPQYGDVFYKPLNQCLEANIATFKNRDVLGMFDDISSIKSEMVRIIDGEIQDTAVPRIPFFWYQCVQDELAPIQKIDAIVANYCNEGAVIEYQRDIAPNLTHKKYGLIGAPKALSWLSDALAGKVMEPRCVNKTANTSELDPGFVALYPEVIGDALLDVVG